MITFDFSYVILFISDSSLRRSVIEQDMIHSSMISIFGINAILLINYEGCEYLRRLKMIKVVYIAIEV